MLEHAWQAHARHFRAVSGKWLGAIVPDAPKVFSRHYAPPVKAGKPGLHIDIFVASCTCTCGLIDGRAICALGSQLPDGTITM